MRHELQQSADKFIWYFLDIVKPGKKTVKGEGPGHPFRGNQYTDGEEGAVASGPTGKQLYNEHAGQIAAVAQKVYDEWDESNVDEYAGGGICHLIAEDVANYLNSIGVEATTVSAEIGDQHVWAVAKLSDGVYNVDISPSVYETGGGYSWEKIPDVKFEAGDIIIERIDPDPDKFDEYIEKAVKGEGPGHPFRGNQWTEGVSGQSEPKTEADNDLKNYVSMVTTHMQQNKRPEGWRFTGPHEVVLQYGKFFDPAERPKGVKKGKDKLCFMNAAHLADDPDYTYVEGFAIPDGVPIPMHHAWCVDKDGNVVDNTWKKPGKAYFGIPFTNGYLWSSLAKTQTYGLLTEFPQDNYNPYRDGFPKEAMK